MRVNQLDASLLDSELLNLFKEQMLNSVKQLNPDITEYDNELMLALHALLFKLTIWDHSTTYGAKLQNLVLKSNNQKLGSKKKLLYFFVVILLPYFYQRFEMKISQRLRQHLRSILTTASFFNFLAFIYKGEYLTIVMRLLRIKFAADGSPTLRNISYEFQNRQLVWNALTEFLLLLLPIMNFKKLSRKLLKPLLKSKRGDYRSLPKRLCAICFEQDSNLAIKGIVNPYTAGCEHPYCYVCLYKRLAEDGEWQCMRCDKMLAKNKMREYMSDEPPIDENDKEAEI